MPGHSNLGSAMPPRRTPTTPLPSSANRAAASTAVDESKHAKPTTPQSRRNQQPIYSEAAMRNNVGVLEYSRTCQSAAAGIAAGILGLQSLAGFVFYFAVVALQAFLWEAKAGFKWSAFFVDRSASFTHSIMSGLFTYILFWVFFYGMVHVY